MRRILFVLVATIAVVSAFASEANYPYTVHKGEITVFGHRLLSNEIRAVEGEYFVSFVESPNKRLILITYDEPFEREAVWLYDKTTKVPPQPIKTDRPGKHFGAEWYGNRVFAIFGAGMGYKASRLIRADDLNHYKEVSDIVAYDPERDVYALLNSDKEFNYFIVVGRAFHDERNEERYPIPLYDQDLTGATGYVENLVFTSKGITVTYKNKDEKTITQTFQSRIVENAKP